MVGAGSSLRSVAGVLWLRMAPVVEVGGHLVLSAPSLRPTHLAHLSISTGIYTLLMLGLGIDRKPSMWNVITSPPSLTQLAGW